MGRRSRALKLLHLLLIFRPFFRSLSFPLVLSLFNFHFHSFWSHDASLFRLSPVQLAFHSLVTNELHAARGRRRKLQLGLLDDFY